MKKIIALVICAMMILSMIPAMMLNASAAGEGDWITKRAPKQSDEELEEGEKYMPAPGYHYDSEGFHTDSPNYKDVAPQFYVRTREAYNLQEGLHLEFRVDEYAYKGPDGDKDAWISLALFPSDQTVPGSTEYGSGWLALIRGTGNGTAQAQPHWTEGRDENGKGGTFAQEGSWPNITVPQDSEGKEIYTFDVEYSNGTYAIKINGESLSGGDKLAALLTDGMCYVSIIGQTQWANDPISITILDWNGTVPSGTDSKEPDENVNSFADFTESDTIPAGQPCFLWDASCQCMRKLPETGANCNISAKGDNTVHITTTAAQCYFSAGPSTSYSYHAEDFPVLAMVLRNYTGGDGQFWYAAGDIMGAQDDAVTGWTLWDDDYSAEYQIGDDLYNFTCVDMKEIDEERWTGRIHGSQRLVFGDLLPEDEEFGEFDLCWFAAFRTVEDARAYADAYVATFGTPETDAPTEAPTDAPTEAPTAAESTPDTAEVGTADGTGEADTKADDSGCASVMGGCAALILTAAAAAVALKRKH